MSIKIKYGPSNSIEIDASRFGTVGEILSNPEVRAVLGFGSNVEAASGDTVLDSDSAIFDGMTLDVRSKSNSKG